LFNRPFFDALLRTDGEALVIAERVRCCASAGAPSLPRISSVTHSGRLFRIVEGHRRVLALATQWVHAEDLRQQPRSV